MDAMLGGSSFTFRSGIHIKPVATALGGALGGAFMGVAQWLLLRRRLPKAGGWVLATGMAAALGSFIWFGIYDIWPKELHYLDETKTAFTNDPVAGFRVTAALAFAGFQGVLQWLVLWRRVSHAGVWILASMTAQAVAVFCPQWLGSVVFGFATGYVLILLLRQPYFPPSHSTFAPQATTFAIRWFYALALPAVISTIVCVLLFHAPSLFIDHERKYFGQPEADWEHLVTGKAWAVGIMISIWVAFLWSGRHAVPLLLQRRPSYTIGWWFLLTGVLARLVGRVLASTVLSSATAQRGSNRIVHDMADMETRNNAISVQATFDILMVCLIVIAISLWVRTYLLCSRTSAVSSVSTEVTPD